MYSSNILSSEPPYQQLLISFASCHLSIQFYFEYVAGSVSRFLNMFAPGGSLLILSPPGPGSASEFSSFGGLVARSRFVISSRLVSRLVARCRFISRLVPRTPLSIGSPLALSTSLFEVRRRKWVRSGVPRGAAKKKWLGFGLTKFFRNQVVILRAFLRA